MSKQIPKLKYHTEQKILKINEIHKNDYNPNFVPSPMMNAIKDDIQKHGFIGNIVVQKRNSEGVRNVVINGEHRWEALKQLGAQEIPAVVLDVPDQTAKLLTLRLNREHGELVPDKVADLLKDLDKSQDMDKLAEITAMDHRELSILMKFDDDIGRQINQATQNTPAITKDMSAYAYGGNSAIQQLDTETNLYYSWPMVEGAIVQLANKIKLEYKDPASQFRAICAIPNGGLIPARLLARELDFYNSKSHHEESILTSIPGRNVRPIIVVDDIVDTGRTYDQISSRLTDTCVYATLVQRKQLPSSHHIYYGDSLNGDKRWVIFPWEKFKEKRRKDYSKILG